MALHRSESSGRFRRVWETTVTWKNVFICVCAHLRGCLVRKEGLPRQEVQRCQPGGGGSLSEHGPPAQLLNGPPAVRIRLEMTPLPYRSKVHTDTEKSLFVNNAGQLSNDSVRVASLQSWASVSILIGSSTNMSIT